MTSETSAKGLYFDKSFLSCGKFRFQLESVMWMQHTVRLFTTTTLRTEGSGRCREMAVKGRHM